MYLFFVDGQGRATVQDHQPGKVQGLLRQDDVHAAGRAGAGASRVGTSEGHSGASFCVGANFVHFGLKLRRWVSPCRVGRVSHTSCMRPLLSLSPARRAASASSVVAVVVCRRCCRVIKIWAPFCCPQMVYDLVEDRGGLEMLQDERVVAATADISGISMSKAEVNHKPPLVNVDRDTSVDGMDMFHHQQSRDEKWDVFAACTAEYCVPRFLTVARTFRPRDGLAPPCIPTVALRFRLTRTKKKKILYIRACLGLLGRISEWHHLPNRREVHRTLFPL